MNFGYGPAAHNHGNRISSELEMQLALTMLRNRAEALSTGGSLHHSFHRHSDRRLDKGLADLCGNLLSPTYPSILPSGPLSNALTSDAISPYSPRRDGQLHRQLLNMGQSDHRWPVCSDGATLGALRDRAFASDEDVLSLLRRYQGRITGEDNFHGALSGRQSDELTKALVRDAIRGENLGLPGLDGSETEYLDTLRAIISTTSSPNHPRQWLPDRQADPSLRDLNDLRAELRDLLARQDMLRDDFRSGDPVRADLERLHQLMRTFELAQLDSAGNGLPGRHY